MRMRIIAMLACIAAAAGFIVAANHPPKLDQKELTELARAEVAAAIARGPYEAALANLRQKLAAQDAVCRKSAMVFNEDSLSCVRPPATPPAVAAIPAAIPAAAVPPAPVNAHPPAAMPKGKP